VDTYNVNDELDGKVTKVVTFGAFVEILDGVEGLVHISELAPHHVESPREIVHPGDEIRVRILEIDSERRRLSLSAKRVEDQILPVARPGQPAGEITTESEAESPEGVAESTAEVAEQPEAAGDELAYEGGETDQAPQSNGVVADIEAPPAGDAPETAQDAEVSEADEPQAVEAPEPPAVPEADAPPVAEAPQAEDAAPEIAAESSAD
jgi:small subunit ribosomal protein S1